jgi:hypothetical protein
MRTEQDLFAALGTREELAPDPDPVLTGARVAAAGYRRRRAAVAGAAATVAIVVAALAAGPVVLNRGTAGDPPVEIVEPFDLAPFAFTIVAGTIDGFEIRPVLVTVDYQLAYILQPGEPEPVAYLVVNRPGAGFDLAGGIGDELLRWEYTPDGYAEIKGLPETAPDEAVLQQLADGVQFTAPRPVRLPYRLDYLPAGLTLSSVSQETTEPGSFRSSVQFERDDQANPLFSMDAAATTDEIIDPIEERRPATVAGRPVLCTDITNGDPCLVEVGGFAVDIGGNVADEELARIIEGLHPADWEDPSTWYEIDDALPGP